MTKIKNILKLKDEIKIIKTMVEMIWEKKKETDDFQN